MNLRDLWKYDQYNGLPVNLNSEDKGLYEAILSNLYSQLVAFSSYHSKALVIRFDLRFPQDAEPEPELESQYISSFFEKLKEKLKGKKYGMTKIAYVWVKEVEKAKKGHFHCVLIVNGHKHNSPGTQTSGIFGLITEVWNRVADAKSGCVQLADHHFLCRGTGYQRWADCFRHISYLAKSRGKMAHPGLKNHGSSRIKVKTGISPSTIVPLIETSDVQELSF